MVHSIVIVEDLHEHCFQILHFTECDGVRVWLARIHIILGALEYPRIINYQMLGNLIVYVIVAHGLEEIQRKTLFLSLQHHLGDAQHLQRQ